MNAVAPLPVAPTTKFSAFQSLPGSIKDGLLLAAPVAAIAAVGVAGGFAGHGLSGAGYALGGVAAIAALDIAYVIYEGKTRTFPTSTESLKAEDLRIKLVLGALPVAAILAGLALHHYRPACGCGAHLMIAGGGAAAANLYLLLGPRLPFPGVSK